MSAQGSTPPDDAPVRRRTSLPMVVLGLVLSLVLTSVIAGFGGGFVRSGGPAVAFIANVAVLGIGGLVCLRRSARWRSLGLGLMIGWAVQVLALGACIALFAATY